MIRLQRAKSDAYFEGGYWILLWEFLLNAAIALFLLVTTLLSFPLDVYVHYFREHQYGLATQSFSRGSVSRGSLLCISLVGFSIASIILAAAFRRAPRTWWMWGAGISMLFFIVILLIALVWIEPLFNTYKTAE